MAFGDSRAAPAERCGTPRPRQTARFRCASAWVLALSTGCGHADPPQRPSAPSDAGAPLSRFVRVAEAVSDAEGSALVAPASVAFDEERVAAIIPPVQGRVVRLLAAAGDHVQAGAPLAVVYSAEVAGAGAGLAEARIARVAAEQGLARAERLAAEGAGAQREVVDARTALALARAEEQRAQSALRALGGQPNAAATYTLRTPIAGTVVRRSLRVGSEARPDSPEPAFLIADLSQVWVLAHLHEQQATAVRAGAPVEIEIGALPGRKFTGTVDRMSDAADPQDRTLVARIVLQNEGNVLKPDMSARVTVRVRDARAVIVPTSALVTQAGGYCLFVESSPGQFERRVVVVGAELGPHTQVLEGLHAGERIVVDGALLIDPSVAQLL